MPLTAFPNGISSQGIPLIGDGIPATYGTVYFVDADNGSNGNNGLQMTQAFSTLATANTAITSGSHDIVVLTANAAHSIASEIALTKSRSHWIGLGGGSRYMGQRTRLEMGVTTAAGTIAIFQNTGVGNTFTNIKFRSTDTLSTSIFAFADGGEFTQCSFCSFEKATDLDQTAAAEFLCNCDTGYYTHCTFGNMIYEVSVARGCVLLTRVTITGKVARDCMFEDCLFLNKTSDTGAVHVLGTTATDVERFMIFKNCIFASSVLGSATQTNAIHNANTQTDGEMICQGCTCQNVTGLGTLTGLFTDAPTSASAGTETVQAAAT